MLNGEALATLVAGESRVFSFCGVAEGCDSLRFSYESESTGGRATLSSFLGGSGMLLIVY